MCIIFIGFCMAKEENGGCDRDCVTRLRPVDMNLPNIIKYLIKLQSELILIKIEMLIVCGDLSKSLILFLFLLKPYNGLAVILFQVRIDKRMRNNFIPSFYKKQSENTNSSIPIFSSKTGQALLESPITDTIKKTSFHFDSSSSQANHFVPRKTISNSEQNSDQLSSYNSSETTIKNKAQRNLAKQKKSASPHNHIAALPFNRGTYPLNSRQNTSPNVKQHHLGFIPMRATLKNLLKTRSPNQQQQNLNESGNLKLNGSYRFNKTELYQSPNKTLQKQYSLLKKQNQILRSQLSEIKKNITLSQTNKKQEVISNLRETIKKQNTEIKELKHKLDIYCKKNILLSTMMQNKEQEISYLTKKVARVEQQLRQFQIKSSEKVQKLKEKINLMLKAYDKLEIKWNEGEMEWIGFKEQWIEEKEMYTQRISFLEHYIANHLE